MSSAEPTKDELKEQLETTRRDLKVLMEMVGGRAGSQVSHARADAEERLTHLSAEARAMLDEARARGADVMGEAEDTVRRNPLAAVGIAFGVGWLIATMLRR